MTREETRAKLRAKLGPLLPAALDTDFQLDRWLDSYHDQVELCAERFTEYARNRRALGYDDDRVLDAFYERDDVRRFHRTFRVSRLDASWVNDTDNGIVFAEMGIGDPNTPLAEFSIGEYLRIFFGYCEYFQRLILRQEARTKRRSHGICIFDMSPMSMMHYANPYAPVNRLLQARVHVWMNYYGEMLKHIVVVNPPRFIGTFFKMLSFLMPESATRRFLIARDRPRDMEKLLARSAIPRDYGGERGGELFVIVDDNGSDGQRQDVTAAPNGIVKAAANGVDGNGKGNGNSSNDAFDGYTELEYLTAVYGLESTHAEEFHVLPGESFQRQIELRPENTVLFYEFYANRDVEASLIGEDGEYLMGRFRLATPLRAECEALRLPRRESAYNATLEIQNHSKLLKMKLRISLRVL